MKNLKNALKMLSVVLLLILVSCKKEEVTPNPAPVVNAVTSTDLLDYYIVAEHKTGGHRMMVAYFEASGNKVMVKATRQGIYKNIGVAVDHEAIIENGRVSIDWNGDGRTSMYRFNVEKDSNGKLILKTYDFEFNGEKNLLAYAILAKKTEALTFEDHDFKMAASGLPFETVKNGIPLSFMRFLGNKVIFWPTRNIDSQMDPYMNLINIGFITKTNALGVTVPYWKGINTPVMLLEIDDLLFMAAKQ